MKKFLAIALIGSLGATSALAADNALQVTNGSGPVIRSVDVGAGVQAPGHAIVDATGGQLGTSTSPLFIRAASGFFASGAFASGSMAAGSHAAGSGVDGWDLTQGAIADAAVTAGATGSVSAKLRSISRDVMTVNTWGGVALGAPSAYGTPPGAVNVPGVNAFVTNTLAAVANNADGVATGTGNTSPVANYNFLFNGTTMDRQRSGGVTGMAGVTLQATPTGGATTFKLIGAASNNSTLIGSAGAHTVYSYQTSSISASTPYWLKFYDKATAPTCGTDTPVKVILIPPTNSGNNGNIPVGFSVSLGLGICVVGGIADSDSTSIAASTVAVNVDYK